MRTVNPAYRYQSLFFSDSITSNSAEVIIQLESVIHHLSCSIQFGTFPTTSGLLIAGFNISDTAGLSNISPAASTNFLAGFASGSDPAASVKTSYQQVIPLDHIVVPAGTRFQVVFNPTGLCNVNAFFSLALNPLTEWNRWHSIPISNRLQP